MTALLSPQHRRGEEWQLYCPLNTGEERNNSTTVLSTQERRGITALLSSQHRRGEEWQHYCPLNTGEERNDSTTVLSTQKSKRQQLPELIIIIIIIIYRPLCKAGESEDTLSVQRPQPYTTNPWKEEEDKIVKSKKKEQIMPTGKHWLYSNWNPPVPHHQTRGH